MRQGGREGRRGIQEYVLIGEHGEQAGCGDPVKTWGAGGWGERGRGEGREGGREGGRERRGGGGLVGSRREGGWEGGKEGRRGSRASKLKEDSDVFTSNRSYFLLPSLPPSLPPSLRYPRRRSETLGGGWIYCTRRRGVGSMAVVKVRRKTIRQELRHGLLSTRGEGREGGREGGGEKGMHVGR